MYQCRHVRLVRSSDSIVYRDSGRHDHLIRQIGRPATCFHACSMRHAYRHQLGQKRSDPRSRYPRFGPMSRQFDPVNIAARITRARVVTNTMSWTAVTTENRIQSGNHNANARFRFLDIFCIRIVTYGQLDTTMSQAKKRLRWLLHYNYSRPAKFTKPCQPLKYNSSEAITP